VVQSLATGTPSTVVQSLATGTPSTVVQSLATGTPYSVVQRMQALTKKFDGNFVNYLEKTETKKVLCSSKM